MSTLERVIFSLVAAVLLVAVLNVKSQNRALLSQNSTETETKPVGATK